jgi:spore coat polysaccharide biosynthesis predicted glycosyltransferase SpsG
LNVSTLLFAEKFAPDVIAFDRLDFDDEHFRILREKFPRMVSISPIFKYNPEMDLVVLREKDERLPPTVHQCAGLDYTIFNHSVAKIQDYDYQKALNSNYLNIGINMGGADKDNSTSEILVALTKVDSPMFFWIMLGYAYRHSYDALKDILIRVNKVGHEFALVRSNENMWDVMRNCSLCILSGGLTAVESVYVGMPSVNIYFSAEHQRVANKSIINSGASIDCGIWSEEALAGLAAKVREVATNRNRLMEMRQQCLSIQICDEGPKNVLKHVERLVQSV